MAVTTLHAQVVLPSLSGLAKDAAINTFTFSADSASTPLELVDVWEPNIEDFYNTPGLTGNPVATYLSRSRSRAALAVETRWYNITTHLNGSAAGPPIAVSNWTLGTYGASAGLPEECAVALSFHGALAGISEFGPGTRPRARHRGRIFIGPLTGNANDGGDTPLYQPRPEVVMLVDIASAGARLVSDSNDKWCVWSRRNAAVYPVVGGWVDDAFDTIRGRGPDPTSRSGFGTLV